MPIISEKELKSFIESEIIKGNKKVRGKKAPIGEFIDNTLISLPVKSIYNMNEINEKFYFIIVKGHLKQPKLRYFLTISLANNSSDFLVYLAKEFAIENDLKLIQYSIYPKTLKTQLLSMKEIKNPKDYSKSIEILKVFRKDFREKLVKIKKLVENE
ncbi:MAG: hypothetical protein ACFFG0_16935 [Candidatus Thorarchaeota archaeon]